MSVMAAAVIGAAVVGAGTAMSNAEDAEDAAYAQQQQAQAGINTQAGQFAAIQKLLQPYVSAGDDALRGQRDLVGLNGAGAQGTAVQAIQNNPQFQALVKQGETSILQNASATGGLRGGNTQAALAQFSPAMLSAAINDQYTRLGSLTTLGQNSAVQQANAGQNTSSAITQLLQQQGAAQAGGIMAQGAGMAGAANSISQGIGAYAGLQNRGAGFGTNYGANTPPSTGWGVGNAGYGDYNAYYDNLGP